jgi:hypothetical protein
MPTSGCLCDLPAVSVCLLEKPFQAPPSCLGLLSPKSWIVMPMDQITIKTPNSKCRLYWCLIELIDWRYSQSCWYFRPLLWTSAPLTFSLVHLPPPPLFLCEISTGVWIYSVQCVTGGGGIRLCGEHRAATGVIQCVFDQIPSLQNCFTTPNKNLGGEGTSDR